MSVPEVGDRVRVIAGQWAGWEGVVTGRDLSGAVLVVKINTSPIGAPHSWEPRVFLRDEVEKVPQTRQNGPQSDARAEDVGLDVPGADGARRGAER